tara:strand:+ start:274 stop:837 length:564 start_codon:yes stop_codon:yes gene_type:complete
MSQLSLNIEEESDFKVIASSAYSFRIDLIKRIGKKDIKEILYMSESLSNSFGLPSVFTEHNISKYFNEKTLPFVARYKNEIVGFIIGVPLENFEQESWAKYDVNLGKNNTIYTYAFFIKDKYRKKGGYAKTLKRIYINWAKKRQYKFVSGHVKQGITQNFPKKTQVVKIFPIWYGLKTPFEYYRRPL